MDPMIASGYERRENDFYETPEWVTEVLIHQLFLAPFFIRQNEIIWEPACGNGAISEVLKRYFKTVMSSDICDSYYKDWYLDFLKPSTICPFSFNSIITNPPYGKLAEHFIYRSLLFTETRKGLVAMLLRNEYDCAKERNYLFTDYPFAMKIVLTTRPKWIEDSTGSPQHNYAWYIWDWKYNELPRITYGHKDSAQ